MSRLETRPRPTSSGLNSLLLLVVLGAMAGVAFRAVGRSGMRAGWTWELAIGNGIGIAILFAFVTIIVSWIQRHPWSITWLRLGGVLFVAAIGSAVLIVPNSEVLSLAGAFTTGSLILIMVAVISVRRRL